MAAFAPDTLIPKLKEAGLDIVGDEKLIKSIKEKDITFDKLYSTLEFLDQLKPHAKILGPKGLMPNKKVGTLVTEEDIVDKVREAKQGSVQFRVDTGANIHSPLGKISFNDDRILKNLKSLMNMLSEKQPSTIKSKYFLEAYMKSTMGPSW